MSGLTVDGIPVPLEVEAKGGKAIEDYIKAEQAKNAPKAKPAKEEK